MCGKSPNFFQNRICTKSHLSNLKTPKLWHFRSISYMAGIGYSQSIPTVPTYILPARKRRMCAKFQVDSFITERLVFVETDRQTDRKTDGQTDMLI